MNTQKMSTIRYISQWKFVSDPGLWENKACPLWPICTDSSLEARIPWGDGPVPVEQRVESCCPHFATESNRALPTLPAAVQYRPFSWLLSKLSFRWLCKSIYLEKNVTFPHANLFFFRGTLLWYFPVLRNARGEERMEYEGYAACCFERNLVF